MKRRKKIMNRILTGMVILLCLGCVPYPHIEVHVPDVTGIITRDGRPLPGAIVRLSEKDDWSCSKGVVAISTTDSVGHFEVKGKKEFRFFRTLLGDPYYINQLCIINDKAIYLGYLGRNVGYPPEALSLKCSINSDSKPVTEKTPMSVIQRYAVCTPDI